MNYAIRHSFCGFLHISIVTVAIVVVPFPLASSLGMGREITCCCKRKGDDGKVFGPFLQLNAGTVKLQGSLKGGSGVPVLLPHLVVVPGTNLVSPGHLSGVRPPDQQAPLVPPIRVPQYPPQPQRAAHLPVPTTVSTQPR